MASIISAGTTSGTALNLSGDTTGILQLASNGTTTAVTIGTDQNATFAGSVKTNTLTSAASTALTLQSAGTTAMTIDTSQNVGIGTTSPGSKLYTQLSSATAYSSGVTGNGLTIYNSSATTNQYVGITLQGEPTTGNGGVATIMGTTTGSGNMDLTFSTRGSATLAERMRIDSSGRVLVGITSTRPNGGFLQVSAQGQTGVATYTTSTTNNNAAYFENGNGIVGSIATNGSATAYNTSSDYRLKENIAPMTGALAKVTQLKPVTYKWKVDGSDGEGFIAHELAEVKPDCVSGEKDAIDADGKPVYQGIDTSFLVATLTAAIQELKAINDTQAATITALTARIVALETV